MFRLRWLVMIPMLAAGLASLTGCSVVKKFEVICKVKNAADGQPLSDVKATVEITQNSKFAGPSTDAHGQLVQLFEINVIALNEDQPRWFLRLEKPGFETERIDIKPDKSVGNQSGVTPLHVSVSMRPVASEK